MKINNKNLINLLVETQAGENLGVVESFNIQTDSQSVIEYIIKPQGLIRSLITEELIISRGQIIDITDKKIIVDDNSITAEIKKRINPLKKKAVAGALMKKK